jgi:hypothetical protein
MSRSFIAFIIVLLGICIMSGCGPQGRVDFIYSDFNIHGAETLWHIDSGESAESQKIAQLWIKVDGDDAIYLPDLTLDQLRAWQDRGLIQGFKESHVTMADGTRIDEFTNGMVAIFKFNNGKLSWMSLDRRKEFKFCLTKDGPFASLPMTREQAISSFGKPLSIQRAKPTAAP